MAAGNPEVLRAEDALARSRAAFEQRSAAVQARAAGLGRLLDDCRRRFRDSSKKLETSECELVGARVALDVAERAAGEDPLDDAKQNALGFALARRDGALRDHELCTRAREIVRVEVSQTEDRLADAHVELERLRADREREAPTMAAHQAVIDAARARAEPARQELLAKITGDSFDAEAAEDAGAIVGAVTELVRRIQAMRSRIGKDNAIVAQLHALGGSPSEVKARDGSAHAGHIANALHAAGGCLHVSNPHELRQITDLPPQGAPESSEYETARKLFVFISASLEQSARNARHGVAGRGRAPLKRVAEAFRRSRDRGEAEGLLRAFSDAGVAASAEQTRREHEERLVRDYVDPSPEAVNRRWREKSGVQAPRPAPPSSTPVISNAAKAQIAGIQDEGDFQFDTVG